ncbi:MAG: DUF4388 domain-containing protein [Thermomicrobiales bacterium]
MPTEGESTNSKLDVLAVLDSLGLRRRTGKMAVIAAGETSSFFLQRGKILMASSTWSNLRLGQTLVRRGALPKERLERSLVLQTTIAHRPSLGTVLVEDGALSREDLALGIEDQCVAVLMRTFEMPDATFLFDAFEAAPRQIEFVPIDATFAVDEAIRRIDNRRQHKTMRQLMPSPTARLGLSLAIADVALQLNDDELSVALAINRRSPTILDLIQTLDFDLVRLQRAIIRLRERGLLVTVEAAG